MSGGRLKGGRKVYRIDSKCRGGKKSAQNPMCYGGEKTLAVEFLASNGADLAAKDKYEQTALRQAGS